MLDTLNEMNSIISEVNDENDNETIGQELNRLLEELKKEDVSHYSSQYKNLIESLRIGELFENKSSVHQEHYKEAFNIQLSELQYNLNVLIQLEPFAKNIDHNILLVGANGAGKSSFANYLSEKKIFSSIAVVPAQKVLFFPSDNSSNAYTAGEVQNKQTQLKLTNQELQGNSFSSFTLVDLFANLVVAVINEDSQAAVDYKNESGGQGLPPETRYDKLNTIFKQLFTGVEFKIKTDSTTLEVTKDQETYDLNAMSDGEKAAIYYILNVLLAKEKSYIIVDEPETYLNQNIASKLWNLLEDYRSDCQFVYITHNIEFINSRMGADLFWMKSGNVKNNTWEIEKVEDVDNTEYTELPRELTIALLGNQKKVLFCEGKGKNSYDYQVYENLFGENYTIFPVGGCEIVKTYTKTYNNSDNLFTGKAVGIIDFDFRDDDEIKKLKNDKIYVNKLANKIEEVLLLPEILEATVTRMLGDEHSKDIISKFKESFIGMVNSNLEKITLKKMKTEIDYYLSTRKLEKYHAKEQMKDDFKKIYSGFNFDDEFDTTVKIISKIKKTEEEYSASLQICNLKKKTKTIVNQKLESPPAKIINYYEEAIKTLREDKDLVKKVVEKYYRWSKEKDDYEN